jgi:hypothetical protein
MRCLKHILYIFKSMFHFFFNFHSVVSIWIIQFQIVIVKFSKAFYKIQLQYMARVVKKSLIFVKQDEKPQYIDDSESTDH